MASSRKSRKKLKPEDIIGKGEVWILVTNKNVYYLNKHVETLYKKDKSLDEIKDEYVTTLVEELNSRYVRAARKIYEDLSKIGRLDEKKVKDMML